MVLTIHSHQRLVIIASETNAYWFSVLITINHLTSIFKIFLLVRSNLPRESTRFDSEIDDWTELGFARCGGVNIFLRMSSIDWGQQPQAQGEYCACSYAD